MAARKAQRRAVSNDARTRATPPIPAPRKPAPEGAGDLRARFTATVQGLAATGRLSLPDLTGREVGTLVRLAATLHPDLVDKYCKAAEHCVTRTPTDPTLASEFSVLCAAADRVDLSDPAGAAAFVLGAFLAIRPYVALRAVEDELTRVEQQRNHFSGLMGSEQRSANAALKKEAILSMRDALLANGTKPPIATRKAAERHGVTSDYVRKLERERRFETDLPPVASSFKKTRLKPHPVAKAQTSI